MDEYILLKMRTIVKYYEVTYIYGTINPETRTINNSINGNLMRIL